MQILFVHQSFPAQFGGAAAALQARGHQVHAIGLAEGPAVPPGCHHHPYRMPPISELPAGLRDPALELALIRAERVADRAVALRSEGFEPDLVLFHSAWGEGLHLRGLWPHALLVAYPELYGSPGLLETGDPDAPAVSTERLRRSARQNLLALAALADADAALTPTHFQRDSFPAPWRGRIQVIHEGVDTARLRPDPGRRIQLAPGLTLGRNDQVLTFVSRSLEPLRGFCRFMRCLPPLFREHPNLQVVVVGDGGHSYDPPSPHPGGYAGAMRERLGPAIDPERFHAVGPLPRDQLTALLQVSSVHAYLSYPYVLSWSLLEAMACGAVVVASDTAPVREVIHHGENGLLVPLEDPEAIASTLSAVLRDPAAHHHLGAAARSTVRQRFSRDHCTQALMAWLESLLLLQSARRRP